MFYRLDYKMKVFLSLLVEIVFNENIYSNDYYQLINVWVYKYWFVIHKILKSWIWTIRSHLI